MENEVFPTNFMKKKNEIYGSNKTFEKPFTNIKTYKGDELKPYMLEKVGEAIQTENIAKYHFDNLNHRAQYNQNVSVPELQILVAQLSQEFAKRGPEPDLLLQMRYPQERRGGSLRHALPPI